MKYLAVLGRQPLISVAELEALYGTVAMRGRGLAEFESAEPVEIARLGGTLKLAQPLPGRTLDYLLALPEGKITLGVSDYAAGATARRAQTEALKLKKILARRGRSVRVLPNKDAALSTAAVLHNGLGRKARAVELWRTDDGWYVGCGVQDIDAYARRDQARPARDAKVGMLPPKLAQILINLCGPLPEGARVLDPFCGTGVVLQEAALMGYVPYGTDLSERMVEYSQKNLAWLQQEGEITTADATNYTWQPPIDAVVCETYLGPALKKPPTGAELLEIKQEITSLLYTFLKNLSSQIGEGTPVTLAIPAWRQVNGGYSRLNILDEIENLGYNVVKYQNLRQEDLLYYREGQNVAREIISLRKK